MASSLSCTTGRDVIIARRKPFVPSDLAHPDDPGEGKLETGFAPGVGVSKIHEDDELWRYHDYSA